MYLRLGGEGRLRLLDSEKGVCEVAQAAEARSTLVEVRLPVLGSVLPLLALPAATLALLLATLPVPLAVPLPWQQCRSTRRRFLSSACPTCCARPSAGDEALPTRLIDLRLRRFGARAKRGKEEIARLRVFPSGGGLKSRPHCATLRPAPAGVPGWLRRCISGFLCRCEWRRTVGRLGCVPPNLPVEVRRPVV